ncbi:alpha/beta fold hydrolase, partial [bacterium]|nr:alpha/beta fold hydrolase [bacterium]
MGKHLALGLLALLALLAIAALVWALTPLGPGAEASAALESDGGLEVAELPYGYEFRPDDPGPAGVLIYPGGRVDARSYAVVANAVARQGNLAVIVRMPLSLAVLSPNAADKVIEAHPEIERWVLVGHSLGGAMGASYAAEHPNDIRGLVLLAAYPPESSNLRESGIAAANLVGTRDTVVDEPNWTSGADRLPADTETVLI